MHSLLIELLQWMVNNNYRRASFDRIIGIVPSAATYEQLNELINDFEHVFRPAVIKGGLPGLALLDDVDAAAELRQLRGEEEAEPMLTSPPASVTESEVEQNIRSEHFFVPGQYMLSNDRALSQLTLCILVLNNGYTVVGKSACVDGALFDPDIGRRIARQDAVRQVWPLLGFRLADSRLAA
jgi:hypothetical protein